MPRTAWVVAVLLSVAGGWNPAAAQPMPGVPAGGPLTLSTTLPPDPNVTLSRTLPPEPAATAPQGAAMQPALAQPVVGAPVSPSDRVPQTPVAVRTAGEFQNAPDLSTTPVPGSSQTQPSRRAVLGTPVESGFSSDPIATIYPTYTPPAASPSDFLGQRTVQVDQPMPPPSVPTSPRPDEKHSNSFDGEFGEKLEQLLGKRCEWFKSDHAFDGFISPVTNPFLFEDPRSLTEVRPIFTIEKIPNAEGDFHGGNTFFFGTQLRLAITDRLSFVINKLGGESFNPGSDSAYPSSTGFAEFWFGPKYTFIRNEDTGTLLAGGLQFQCPTGPHGNFQDTGTLTLVPYFSYAQNFLRDFAPGSMNGMVGGGYALSVNGERSDYFYLSAHIDMDVLNQRHWYPFIEMNWFMYTTNGNTTPVGIEGEDLINFGGHAAGQGELSLAFGTRYKFTENYQIGGAFEFPLAGPHDLMDYRFTLDFIFRY